MYTGVYRPCFILYEDFSFHGFPHVSLVNFERVGFCLSEPCCLVRHDVVDVNVLRL